LISIMLQTAYGVVDLLIVSQFSSVGDTSGVTISSQIIKMITALFTGLSMGSTVLIGNNIGSKQLDQAAKYTGASVALFSVLAFATTLLLLLFCEAIVFMMNTPHEAIGPATSYLTISALGTIFIVFYNLLGSIFRGIGDSKTPLVAVSIAFAVNIILDLLLIAIFDMGATGAAIATVAAQGVSVALSFFVIRKNGLPFPFSKREIKFDLTNFIDILRIGIPVALQGTMVSASFLVITAIVNDFGVQSSAAVGIVEKITGVIMVVPIAFMQSLSAFTAQNHGAGRLDRARQGLKYGIIYSLSFGFITAYLSAFHGTLFTTPFKPDEATTIAALEYLKSYSFDCVFVAIMFCACGYFNGCGHTTFVMFQAVFSAFCIRIPLAYLLSKVENTSLFLIGLATPSSTFVQIIMIYFFYQYTKKNTDSLPTSTSEM
ncbi:MAG: MATE family efflux transporter, partial [Eubacteriales bacterium]